MREKKKTLAGLLIFCAGLLGLSGCSSEMQRREVSSIRIGVTLYDQYDTFVSQLLEHFNNYAAKKEKQTGIAINIEVYNAADSQLTQNDQVEEMLEDGCDVICVNLVDRTEPTAIIDMAEKQAVPVIFFNRELVAEDLERWDRLYYVGAKAFESGIMEGELAAEAFLENPAADKNGDGVFQYIVLEGEAGHQDAIVRTEYSVSTMQEQGVKVEKLGYAIANWNRAQAQTKMTQLLAEYGERIVRTEYSVSTMQEQGVKVEKLGYAIANWNRAQAQTKMTQLLAEYGERIELVLANNDDMALGAIDALKADGRERQTWPIIVGIDGTDVGLLSVKNKEMAGTVYNDKEGQAEAMLELAYALAVGDTLTHLELEQEKYIRLPYEKVRWDEVDAYIK